MHEIKKLMPAPLDFETFCCSLKSPYTKKEQRMKSIHMYLAASVIALSACSGGPSMSAFVGTYEKVQNEKDKRVFEILKKDGSLVIKGELAEPDRYSLKRIFSTKPEELPVFEVGLRPITNDEIIDINRYETIRLETSNTWVSKEPGLMVTHFKDKDSEARYGSKYVLWRGTKPTALNKLN